MTPQRAGKDGQADGLGLATDAVACRHALNSFVSD